MKKRTIIAIVVPTVLIVALVLYSALSGKEKEVVLETKVEQGTFEIAVMERHRSCEAETCVSAV